MNMKRYERAAAYLAAGKKVSVSVEEIGNVKDWLDTLRSYLIVDHTDPGDEVTYKVWVTVKEGKATASAKKVLVESW